MSSKEIVLNKLLQKKGMELVQFIKDFSGFFKLTSNESFEVSPENKELLESISGLNLGQIIEIRNSIMEKHSISFDEIVAVNSNEGGNSQGAADVSTMKIILNKIPDANKTQGIKLVKEILGLTISESKAIIDKVIAGNEHVLKEGLTPAQANEIAEKFTKEGITAVVQAG